MECSFADVGCYFQWLVDEVKQGFLWLVDNVLSGLVILIDLVPVPDFLLNIGSFGLPSSALYFTTLFAVPQGLSMVVAAYIFRFILRRIPLIG